MPATRLTIPSAYQTLGFPTPKRDRFGMRNDPIYLAARPIDGGFEYVLVHSRPLTGQTLFFFLKEASGEYGIHGMRKHVAGSYSLYETRPPYEFYNPDDAEFNYRQHRFHDRVGKYGIGEQFTAFEREACPDWVRVTDDDSIDSVFAVLRRTWIIRDMRETAAWQIDKWKQEIPKTPPWWGAEMIYKLIHKIHPTDELEDIWRTYRGRNNYEPFGKALGEYIDSISEDAAVDLVGNAYRQFPYAIRGSTNHTLANRLVIDLAGRQTWIEMPYVYAEIIKGNEVLQYPVPKVHFVDGTVVLSDENGTYARLGLGEGDDPSRLVPWSIEDFHLPDANYTNGLYPAVAWRVSRDGERTFLSHDETIQAVREAGIPVKGTPDSYLGKIMIRYFGASGEFEESPSERKWLKRMGLPGSDQKREIGMRELPVFIQLPQHQQDLLGSEFLMAAEATLLRNLGHEDTVAQPEPILL